MVDFVQLQQAAVAVDPRLMPAFSIAVEDVETRAGVTAAAVPALLQRASAVDRDDAVTSNDLTARIANVPIALPEIELTVFRAVFAGCLRAPGLVEEFGEAGIVMKRHQVHVAGKLIGECVASLKRFIERRESSRRIAA